MSTTRRQFLQATVGSSALVSLTPSVPSFLFDTSVQAAATDPRRRGENILVVVQLTGGNDGLNTIVPYTDDAYHRNRSSLNVATQVLKINDALGFHPSMRGMADLLQAGELAIVQGVGYPNPNRSHFESMDIWHTAQPQVTAGGRRTGWIGRCLDHALTAEGRDVPALHLGHGRQPLALAGETVHAASVQSLEAFKLDDGGDARLRGAIDVVAAPPRHGDLLKFLQRSTVAALASSERVQEALRNYSTPVRYPSFPLGQQLRTVAQLIDAGLTTRIYYLSLDGFDTHSQQAAAHAGLLGQLSDALAAFFQDLHHHGQADRVVLATFSEFGRRVKENASVGTDHGVAGPMFIVGPRVRPGPFGDHPSLTDLTEGDLKFHTDFRQVYATLIDRWLGFDSRPTLTGDYGALPLLKA
jgi:uncharacterized protein (DUF1501 family)